MSPARPDEGALLVADIAINGATVPVTAGSFTHEESIGTVPYTISLLAQDVDGNPQSRGLVVGP